VDASPAGRSNPRVSSEDPEKCIDSKIDRSSSRDQKIAV
jgi:hypothetical protein